MDDDDDNSCDYREWTQALRPRRNVRGGDYGARHLSVEQKNLFQRAWLEQLATVFEGSRSMGTWLSHNMCDKIATVVDENTAVRDQTITVATDLGGLA